MSHLFLHSISFSFYNYFTVFLGLKKKKSKCKEQSFLLGLVVGLLTVHNDFLLYFQDVFGSPQWALWGHSHFSPILTCQQ